jgi:hypothetical protein
MDWKNILTRAAWTFVQAFVAATGGAIAWDINMWKVAAVAGAAAVLSLLKTVAQEQLLYLEGKP